MSIIEIPDELAQQIRNRAEQHGQGFSEYVVSTLRAGMESDARVPTSEEEVLNDGFASSDSVLAIFEKAWAMLTPEDTAASPSDLAEEHDHYIYGTRKRSEQASDAVSGNSERVTPQPPNVRAIVEDPDAPSYLKEILKLAYSLPEETLESFPTDGAVNHDHYLYGVPKRQS